jgi:membrane protease YdiL (CAAX protease family)
MFTLVVPEFRRALPILFQRPRLLVSRADAALAFAVTLCWGYGLYRAGFCLPVLQVEPEWFKAFGLSDAMPEFKARYLLILGGIVIVAPFAEELVFRGFLLNLWVARWGACVAIVASSIFFGVMHWERALFAGVLGVALALVYLKYDSLWPGIALHAAYNLLTFYWFLGGFFGVKDRATVQDPSNWIPEIALAILFFPFAWLFWRRFRPGRPAG